MVTEEGMKSDGLGKGIKIHGKKVTITGTTTRKLRKSEMEGGARSRRESPRKEGINDMRWKEE